MTTTTLRADAATHPAAPPGPQDTTAVTERLVRGPWPVDRGGHVELDDSSEWSELEVHR